MRRTKKWMASMINIQEAVVFGLAETVVRLLFESCAGNDEHLTFLIVGAKFQHQT